MSLGAKHNSLTTTYKYNFLFYYGTDLSHAPTLFARFLCFDYKISALLFFKYQGT